ncbi:MAG TPA: hypothetical protein VEB22_00955 [Phycisphaerales bacterium]|nr:hypothetical protein [Phycisphaerales bacterium]
MPDPRDTLDLTGRPADPPPEPNAKAVGGASASYLRIYFSCSNTYARAQRTAAGDAYTARCPSCGQMKRFLIGEGGTSDRSFVLSCR